MKVTQDGFAQGRTQEELSSLGFEARLIIWEKSLTAQNININKKNHVFFCHSSRSTSNQTDSTVIKFFYTVFCWYKAERLCEDFCTLPNITLKVYLWLYYLSTDTLKKKAAGEALTPTLCVVSPEHDPLMPEDLPHQKSHPEKTVTGRG